jgi:asparaginyl-tRNA synthetase
VNIVGTWQPSPSGKEQSYELHAQAVKVLGENDSAVRTLPSLPADNELTLSSFQAYPIQKKYHTPEYLRTLPHLRTRIPYHSLLLRLRSQVIGSVTSYFTAHDYVQTHPPIMTSSDCEGAGEVFSVVADPGATPRDKQSHDPETSPDQFFRTAKYLTVSSQLHLEALAQSVGKVWALSPTFRAERSDTPRHLSEFYMLEAELCFVDDVNEVMDVVESLLREVAIKLESSQLGVELLSALGAQQEDSDSTLTQHELKERWRGLASERWPRITYADAVSRLQDAMSRQQVNFQFTPEIGAGLQAEHEKYLAETVGHGSPVFVTDYPRSIKAFYMAPTKNQSDIDQSLPTVACFDLLVPELCEIVGGSMREHRLGPLLEAMASNGLLPDIGDERKADATTTLESHTVSQGHADETAHTSLEWYVDLRRYGSVPHGGFGIGFDRLLSYLSGVSNIRDVVSFPRWYGRCDC